MTSPSVTLLRTQSDERLAALAAAGHERAFEAIVERYRRPLLRPCRRYLPEGAGRGRSPAGPHRRPGGRCGAATTCRICVSGCTGSCTTRCSTRCASPVYDYEQLRDTLKGDGGPGRAGRAHAPSCARRWPGWRRCPSASARRCCRSPSRGGRRTRSRRGSRALARRRAPARAPRAHAACAPPRRPPCRCRSPAGWVRAAAARGDLVARVGELVAGAGGGATLAKAGAVAVVAGGAVSAPE